MSGKKSWLIRNLIVLSALSISLSVEAGELSEYDPSKTDYIGGDQVFQNGTVYECRGGVYTGWCNQSAYSPAGASGHMAWIEIGEYVPDDEIVGNELNEVVGRVDVLENRLDEVEVGFAASLSNGLQSVTQTVYRYYGYSVNYARNLYNASLDYTRRSFSDLVQYTQTSFSDLSLAFFTKIDATEEELNQRISSSNSELNLELRDHIDGSVNGVNERVGNVESGIEITQNLLFQNQERIQNLEAALAAVNQGNSNTGETVKIISENLSIYVGDNVEEGEWSFVNLKEAMAKLNEYQIKDAFVTITIVDHLRVLGTTYLNHPNGSKILIKGNTRNARILLSGSSSSRLMLDNGRIRSISNLEIVSESGSSSYGFYLHDRSTISSLSNIKFVNVKLPFFVNEYSALHVSHIEVEGATRVVEAANFSNVYLLQGIVLHGHRGAISNCYYNSRLQINLSEISYDFENNLQDNFFILSNGCHYRLRLTGVPPLPPGISVPVGVLNGLQEDGSYLDWGPFN